MSEESVQFVKKISYKRVAKDRVVTLRFMMVDRDAARPVEVQEELSYLHGGYGDIFPKVEAALEGAAVEDKLDLELSADEAFGPRNEKLVMEIPAERLPEEARAVGMRIEGETGDGRSGGFTVTAVEGNSATIDGNHPLAGRNLQLFIKVIDVREAGEEEIRAGHPIVPPKSGGDAAPLPH
ncbi:FKBP-type peptidyl-prolyl cis-trans isomerase [Endothiovibrio diazotrophicus]